MSPEPTLRLALRLRPRSAFDPAAVLAHASLPPAQRTYLHPADHADRHGASQADLARVADFAAAEGLAVLSLDGAKRQAVLAGLASKMEALFGPMEAPILPAALADVVVGVLGRDPAPRLRPHVMHAMDDVAALKGSPTNGFTGAGLADRYGFPAGDGAGLRVGVIELGGGFDQTELDTFFQSLGLAVAPIRIQTVVGGSNNPTGAPQAERFEVALDLQVLGAVVPKATITVYFAPNTDQGFMDALQAALHDPEGAPSVVSISWGSAESQWAPLDFILFDEVLQQAAAQGVTVVCSAGDFGSRDGLTDGKAHVTYPAASAWSLAVGGTTWADGQAAAAEVVWNSAPSPGATGGGVSDTTDLPDWQKTAGVPPSVNDGKVRRGVPDVAAVADMATGYRVFLDGQWWVIGGTSAAAPLWAGLVARCQGALGAPCGFLNPLLYGKARTGLRAIPTGSNGDYHATTGYSACTGLGVPVGETLLAGLR